MKKIKICGIGNERDFNYWILEKNSDFFEILSRILYDAFGIIDDSIRYDEYVGKKDRLIRRKKNIKTLIDKYERFQNEKARVELFYGKNKIFMSVYTSFPNRKKFIQVLEKVSIWKNPKKIDYPLIQ